MYEIKYRAFDKKSKDMPIVIQINLKNKTVTVERDKDKNGSWVQIKSFDDVVLMQSTGLKDINGVEIWDGDIVEYRDGEYSFIGVMARTVLGLYVWGTYDNIDIDDVASDADNRADLVVLGNIYENPELLDDAEIDY